MRYLIIWPVPVDLTYDYVRSRVYTACAMSTAVLYSYAIINHPHDFALRPEVAALIGSLGASVLMFVNNPTVHKAWALLPACMNLGLIALTMMVKLNTARGMYNAVLRIVLIFMNLMCLVSLAHLFLSKHTHVKRVRQELLKTKHTLERLRRANLHKKQKDLDKLEKAVEEEMAMMSGDGAAQGTAVTFHVKQLGHENQPFCAGAYESSPCGEALMRLWIEFLQERGDGLAMLQHLRSEMSRHGQTDSTPAVGMDEFHSSHNGDTLSAPTAQQFDKQEKVDNTTDLDALPASPPVPPTVPPPASGGQRALRRQKNFMLSPQQDIAEFRGEQEWLAQRVTKAIKHVNLPSIVLASTLATLLLTVLLLFLSLDYLDNARTWVRQLSAQASSVGILVQDYLTMANEQLLIAGNDTSFHTAVVAANATLNTVNNLFPYLGILVTRNADLDAQFLSSVVDQLGIANTAQDFENLAQVTSVTSALASNLSAVLPYLMLLLPVTQALDQGLTISLLDLVPRAYDLAEQNVIDNVTANNLVALAPALTQLSEHQLTIKEPSSTLHLTDTLNQTVSALTMASQILEKQQVTMRLVSGMQTEAALLLPEMAKLFELTDAIGLNETELAELHTGWKQLAKLMSLSLSYATMFAQSDGILKKYFSAAMGSDIDLAEVSGVKLSKKITFNMTDIRIFLEMTLARMYSCGIVAAVVAFLSASLVTSWTAWAYRIMLTKMQLGAQSTIPKYMPEEYLTTRAPLFMGIQFSTALFGYWILGFIVWAILFAISWPGTWAIFTVTAVQTFLFFTISTMLLKMLLLDRVVGRIWLSDGHVVTRPALWSWYSLLNFFLGFLTGFVSAGARLGMLFCIALMSLFRLDATIFPSKFATFDSGWLSFMSVVMTQYRHQSEQQLDELEAHMQERQDKQALLPACCPT